MVVFFWNYELTHFDLFLIVRVFVSTCMVCILATLYETHAGTLDPRVQVYDCMVSSGLLTTTATTFSLVKKIPTRGGPNSLLLLPFDLDDPV